VAVLVVDVTVGISQAELELLKIFQQKNIPYVLAFNKVDVSTAYKSESSLSKGKFEQQPLLLSQEEANIIRISAKTGFQIQELKRKNCSSCSTRGIETAYCGRLDSAWGFCGVGSSH